MVRRASLVFFRRFADGEMKALRLNFESVCSLRFLKKSLPKTASAVLTDLSRSSRISRLFLGRSIENFFSSANSSANLGSRNMPGQTLSDQTKR